MATSLANSNVSEEFMKNQIAGHGGVTVKQPITQDLTVNEPTQSARSNKHTSSTSDSHWLFDWLDSVVAQSLLKIVGHSKYPSSVVYDFAKTLGFSTRLACAAYYQAPEFYREILSSGDQDYPIHLDQYLRVLQNGSSASSDCVSDDRANFANLATLFQKQQTQLPNRTSSSNLFAYFASADTIPVLNSAQELSILAEFRQWISSPHSPPSPVPLQTVAFPRSSSYSPAHSSVNPSLSQTGILQNLIKRAATVARPARPAHPNSRPIALLNTAAVEQLVHSTTGLDSEPMDPTTTPRVDSPQTPTSSTPADGTHQNGLEVYEPKSPTHELLADLALAATRGEDDPPLPGTKGPGSAGFYVAKQPSVSTTSSDVSPPESVENSATNFERNKFYTTFCKRPTPEFSNKLPVIGSPARVRRNSSTTPSAVSPSTPTKDVPGLRSEFQKRKLSQPSVSATKQPQASSTGTTTWAASSSVKMAGRKVISPSSSTDVHISSSTNGVPDSSGKPVSRSSTAALRLSLDQRRRAIELGRQRALIANNKAAVQRHHAAFQKLLQTEQRRRGSKQSSDARHSTPVQPEPDSECTGGVISSSSVMDPVSQGTGSSEFINDKEEVLQQSVTQNTDIEEEFAVPYTSNLQPSATADDLPINRRHNQASSDCQIKQDSSESANKRTSSPEPIECAGPSEADQDAFVIDQHSLPGRLRSDSSQSGSDPVDSTLPSVASDMPVSWFHATPRLHEPKHSGRPRQSTPQASFDDYSPVNPYESRFKRRSPRYDPHLQHTHASPVVHHHSSSSQPLRHSACSGFTRHDPVSQSLTRSKIRQARRGDDFDANRRMRYHPLAASEAYDVPRARDIYEPDDEGDAFYDYGDRSYDYGEDEEDESESGSDVELDARSNYSRDRWTPCRRSERSFSTPRAHPVYVSKRPRSSLGRRRASPTEDRHHRHSDRQDVSTTALEELNRNLLGLQTGLERLLAAGSHPQSVVEGPRSSDQQFPSQLTASTTSLTGTTRATWNDRPKLLDIASNRPLDGTPEPVESSLTIPSAVGFEDTSSKSECLPPGSKLPEVAPQRPKACAFTVDIGPDSKHAKSPDQPPPASKPKEPENKVFFIAFDEPDPQRMQRKCDQLEARRAAEKALLAQRLQERRSQEREARRTTDQASLERKLNEREKREAILQAYKEKRDVESASPRLSELYPVRPGSAALSRSEANIYGSPKDRRTSSGTLVPSKRGGKQAATNTRASNPAMRRKSLTKSTTSLHSSSSALRGNADGEAGENSDRDEDSNGKQKADRLNNGKVGARLPSGLSLSSLHRLGCSDAPSSGPGLQVTSSTQPKLFVKPKAKSNRMVIVNAISHACLAGAVNEPMKQATLKELAATEGTHFMILFRDSRCQYRAVYSFDLELEELRLICGTGPRRITHEMANRFFKYNSGGKHFTEITSTNHLSPVVDAITIHESLWTKSSGQAAALNLLSGRP